VTSELGNLHVDHPSVGSRARVPSCDDDDDEICIVDEIPGSGIGVRVNNEIQ
jgi:hypothetical protein